MSMTSRERFVTALRNEVPDRVPVTPDFSCYIPCKRTGLPFWEVLFEEAVPLWRAYLDTADYFGIDPWTGGHMGLPAVRGDARAEWRSELAYDRDRDAMTRATTMRTPDGDLTQREICFRAEPPTLVEKPIKDLRRDWKKYRWTLDAPTGVDDTRLEEFREACRQRECAFGLGMGYPGFHIWSCFVKGGISQLLDIEIEEPAILEEWYARELEVGTRTLELMLACRPDYVFLGGSGTLTLASPMLARKYAIPAIARWTRMAREAGVPTLLHSCGLQRQLVDMLVEHTDLSCVNPLEMPPMGDVDLAEVKAARGDRIALMGNLHTTQTMLLGSPEDVRRAAVHAMRQAGRGGGFILSTGDQCGRDTPEENLFAMVEAAREWGVYNRATGDLPALEAGMERARRTT
jgi:uroporphyrinogen decarboxylase